MKVFEECIALVNKLAKPTDKAEHKKKDKLEIAQFHQNIYLCNVSLRKFDNANESSQKCIDIMAEIFGPKSKRLASKNFQKANSCLNMNKHAEATKFIRLAIDIHENPVEKEQDDLTEEEKA